MFIGTYLTTEKTEQYPCSGFVTKLVKPPKPWKSLQPIHSNTDIDPPRMAIHPNENAMLDIDRKRKGRRIPASFFFAYICDVNSAFSIVSRRRLRESQQPALTESPCPGRSLPVAG